MGEHRADGRTQQFWERSTGGTIAYGPEVVRIDVTTSAYARYRRINPIDHADLYQSAYQHVRGLCPVVGPLIWRPPPNVACSDSSSIGPPG